MSLQAFEIPLKSNNQRLVVTLGNVQYRLTVVWCHAAQAWTLDMADINNVPIVTGLQLVTGADLLGQLTYLGFTGKLVVQTDSDVLNVPTFTNLGTLGHLYFVTGQ